jgi:hypothetical protein
MDGALLGCCSGSAQEAFSARLAVLDSKRSLGSPGEDALAGGKLDGLKVILDRALSESTERDRSVVSSLT